MSSPFVALESEASVLNRAQCFPKKTCSDSNTIDDSPSTITLASILMNLIFGFRAGGGGVRG